MRRVKGYLLDHPSVVTLTLVGLVITHFLLAKFLLPSLSPASLWNAVPSTELPQAVSSLAIGVAGVAAMVGGFAGVVVVFGLSSDDERFRRVRVKASTSLRRNWMSIVATPLAAAFGAMVASAMATAAWTSAAIWAIEICVLLAAHGAVRLVVLLNELVRVVHESDRAAEDAANTVDTDEFFSD